MVERGVRARCVAVRRREQRGADGKRHLARHVDEPLDVLLVAVAPRVGGRAEQALRLRELGRDPAVLHLARRSRESPRPAGQYLLRRERLPLADRAEEDADTRGAILLPGRCLGHERHEVVEVGAVDRRRDAIHQRGHAEAPIRVLRGARGEELLEGALVRSALGELLRELRALVEADLASRDRGPEALLLGVEVLGIDPLPLALDDVESTRDVGGDWHEPRHRRELAARPALLAPARCGRDARALAVEVGVEQRVQRDDALGVGRALRDEIDDHAGFFPGMDAHDPADALLVDAPRRGRSEVHADGRAR